MDDTTLYYEVDDGRGEVVVEVWTNGPGTGITVELTHGDGPNLSAYIRNPEKFALAILRGT